MKKCKEDGFVARVPHTENYPMGRCECGEWRHCFNGGNLYHGLYSMIEWECQGHSPSASLKKTTVREED